MNFTNLGRASGVDYGILFKLSEPVTLPTGLSSNFVIASHGSETILGEDETYGVFLANEKGQVLNWETLTDIPDPPSWIYDLY
jgi:hypothetical protein